MEKLPENIKNNLFEAPEGYYEQLADRVLARKEKEASRSLMIRWAAAATFVLGASLLLFKIDFQETPEISTALLLDT